jgi:outer membrane protein TolC
MGVAVETHIPLTKRTNFIMLNVSMRKTGLAVAVLAGCVCLHAQESAVVHPSPANTVGTANAAALPNRQISLIDAVEMALNSNLDIQITRLDPTIAGYNLKSTYGVYDPRVRLAAEHAYDKSPGGFLGNVQFPSQITEVNTFGGGLGSGVSGYGPMGFGYGIGGSLQKRNSKSGALANGTDDYSGGLTLDMSQPLLRGFLIDDARAQIKISRRNLRISEEQLRFQIMTTILNVEQAYYNLIYARENVRVQATALELASQLLRENRKRVEVGALAPLDEKQAESEVASTKAALIDAERTLSQQQNVLKGLLTDNYSEWNGVNLEPVEALVAVPTRPDVQESWGRGLRMRADLQQLKYQLEIAGITLKLRKNQILPILDVTGSYGHSERAGAGSRLTDVLDRLPEGRNPNYSIGGVLEIPIGNVAARNRYKSAKASSSQSLLQYKQLEQQVMVQIDDAVNLIRSSFERVEATRSARSFAQEALAAEQKKLENGKSTSFFVLQFQRDLTVRRSDEIRALADYNNAVALLANREGTTLERHHIEMK